MTRRGEGRMGVMAMNTERAEQNAQFALNLTHWLSGLLPGSLR